MKKGTIKRKNYVLRVIILAILISVSGILLARAFYSSDQAKGNSRYNYFKGSTLSLASYRGSIYDRNHRELAINTTAYSIYAHPLNVDDPDRTATALSNILRIDQTSLLKLLKCEKAFVWVARRVIPMQLEMIKNLKLKGVHFVSENYRVYPRNSLAAQFIGFADSDGHGVEGLELAYDRFLCNAPLSLQNKSDELTQFTFNGGIIELGTNRGNNIHLTLDENIQAFAEKELGLVLAKNGAKAGTVIVMDVGTGALLAMCNHPSYNPNVFWDAHATLRKNRAITDAYELGGLIKFFGDVAALEEQSIKARSISDPCMDSEKADAIEHPTPQFLYNFLLKLGFGNKTGISLPAESSGTLPPYDVYKDNTGALYRGEGITATPLQLITAFGAIINRGKLMLPHAVIEVTDGQGNLLKEHQSVCIRKVCTPQTSEEICSMLIKDRGSRNDDNFIIFKGCGHIQLPGRSSQPNPSIDKSKELDYIKYSLGCMPAKNPRVAVLFVMETGPEEVEISENVECRVRDIASASLKALARGRAKACITPRKEKEYQGYGEKTKTENGDHRSAGKVKQAMVMPDVRGRSMREALHMLQGYDIFLVVTGSGIAVSQSPLPGAKLKKTSRCMIEFKPPS